MALLHRADLTPTKLELLAGWLPGRTWFAGSADAIERVAACRLDDPAGEVGVEIIIVRAGDGPAYQVPLTYRGAPLAGAEHHLVGTTAHSVLGRRWVYDACGDPVYTAVVAATIRDGGGQAEEFVDGDDGPVRRDPAMTLAGSGSRGAADPLGAPTVTDGTDATAITDGTTTLTVVRVLDGTRRTPAGPTLTGTWDGRATLLAHLDPA